MTTQPLPISETVGAHVSDNSYSLLREWIGYSITMLRQELRTHEDYGPYRIVHCVDAHGESVQILMRGVVISEQLALLGKSGALPYVDGTEENVPPTPGVKCTPTLSGKTYVLA